MKYLSAIAVVILLLCGGAMWFLASGSLNDFIKHQIETQGLAATKQSVTVGSVDIRFSQAAGTIQDLALANINGFPSKDLYQLKHITLDINMKSLKDSPIVIDAINIDGSSLNIDLNAQGKSNIQILKEQLALPDGSPENSAPASEPTKEPKIRISQLLLTNINAKLNGEALGGEVYNLTLPKVIINDIGGEGGVPSSQLGQEILKKVVDQLWQETKKIQKDKLKEKFENKLKDKVSDKLKSLIQ